MCAKQLIAVVVSSLLLASSALAAPWDIDMFRQQSLKPNEVARNPVSGTVPLGFKPFPYATREEAGEKMTKDVEFGVDSVSRGQRLWGANCEACHGVKADAQGTVSKIMNVPSLLDEMYKARADGFIYGTLHYGGAVMPRYGYKFSHVEKWDLVNYLRFLQGRDVPGMPRP
ncbi:MAG: cytochrome c [bacterium]|nr:cytochrome c [bacterium]